MYAHIATPFRPGGGSQVLMARIFSNRCEPLSRGAGCNHLNKKRKLN